MISAPDKPIADYGIIGDCRTAALVSSDGSIDWCCLPHFDSPSVFARLLDWRRGGHFALRPAEAVSQSRRYLPHTSVLETEFRTPNGRAMVTDFMPKYLASENMPSRIVRLVRCIEGFVDLDMEFAPRSDYGRRNPQMRKLDDRLFWHKGAPSFSLASSIPLREKGSALAARLLLRQGQQATFVLQAGPPEGMPREHEVGRLLDLTEAYWRSWASRCTYQGLYRDAVVRSALVLKLLSYEPSGSIVAAPTTSLPEHIEGGRNWDYRFTWLRDTAFAADALYLLGFPDFANGFFHWVCDVVEACRTDLQIMYAIDGGRRLPEEILDHLEGYRGSRPVRIGNAASQQLQLDVYGEILGCVHTCRRHGADDTVPLWLDFKALVDWVCLHWREPDSGIWEMRSEPRHDVLSKAMCWVALDRGLRAARELGLEADLAAWEAARAETREEVLSKGFDANLGSFVQSYECPCLDAANLLLPVVGFIDARDPRMMGTVARTRERLMENGLVYRYRDAEDGVGGPEGAFVACSLARRLPGSSGEDRRGP